ncbi:helix-turn-helix transcriptional regulator [Leisingera sp. D0M16]|uniref:helix-turn-helix transcriptional regulator n=1 Tax=Leisingera coralii TaxID=3351347 RepID=UPI003BA13848
MAELLDQIEAATSLDVLRHRITPQISQLFNADHIIYFCVCSSGSRYVWGTYPAEWIKQYLEQGYFSVDPVFQGCRNCFHPIDWRRLDWSHVSARKFQADAQAHGLGNQGISIPIRGPHGQFAVFSVNRSCSDETWHEFTGQRTRDLILTAHAFNERVLQLQPDLVPQAVPHLGKREIDALALLARGCSRAEAAAKLNISESTLRTYIETARNKLSAANTTQAVAIAASRGLIVV